MRRRQFLVTIAIATACPETLLAQKTDRIWRIGVLVPRKRPVSFETEFWSSLIPGLRSLGYEEGRNISIDWRFSDGDPTRLEDMAKGLVLENVDVIVTVSTTATSAAQRATATIPIVMGSTNDPVGSGFARSLARPGGNITGLSSLTGDVSSKHVELLRDLLPGLDRIAVLANPTNASYAAILTSLHDAAQQVNVRLEVADVRSPEELQRILSEWNWADTQAIIVTFDTIFVQEAVSIAKLCASHHVPTIATNGEFAQAGGLMSYGQSVSENFRRAATYVDKIIKGAKPADLPIEQAMRFELVINLKTAKALEIEVPPILLTRADQVIE